MMLVRLEGRQLYVDSEAFLEGFRVLGLRVWGFRVQGLGLEGFKVLGLV